MHQHLFLNTIPDNSMTEILVWWNTKTTELEIHALIAPRRFPKRCQRMMMVSELAGVMSPSSDSLSWPPSVHDPTSKSTRSGARSLQIDCRQGKLSPTSESLTSLSFRLCQCSSENLSRPSICVMWFGRRTRATPHRSKLSRAPATPTLA